MQYLALPYHWLYAERAYEDGADQPKELPAPILNHGSRETVVAAARFAIAKLPPFGSPAIQFESGETPLR